MKFVPFQIQSSTNPFTQLYMSEFNAFEQLEQPPFKAEPAVVDSFARFVAIVRFLRQECPWDREQTHDSVKHLLIEEAYEAVEAIDEENWSELKKELGDLLLHVLFHSTIAENEGTFDLVSVIETEGEKLIRRHPHVFGDTAVQNTEEVLQNWERIKVSSGEKQSILDGIPAHLPALLRAQRIQEKVAGVGFDFPDATEAWMKVEEELSEFQSTEQLDDQPGMEEEFGDVLFALVNFARLRGLNPENALRRTNEKFRHRFQYVEARLQAEGRSVAEASLEEMDAYWEAAKRRPS